MQRNQRPHWRAALAGLAMLVCPLVGCGPSLYTFNVIPAQQALEEAREANAPESAPYEYYFARSYLEKAREEASEANYQDAIRFAETAHEFAGRARDLARQRAQEPE